MFLPSMLAFMLFFSACRQEDETLIIAVTTDVHGMIFPRDFIARENSDHSLAHIYNYVCDQRDKKDTLFFFWITEISCRASPPYITTIS